MEIGRSVGDAGPEAARSLHAGGRNSCQRAHALAAISLMQESTDAPAAAASNHGVHGTPHRPVRNEALPLAAAATARVVVLSMIAATM